MVRKKSKFSFGKMHFLGWVILTVVNTMIVLNDDKKSRMMLLIVVIVLQHLTLLFFMLDYENLQKNQWKQKEERLKKELGVTPVSSE